MRSLFTSLFAMLIFSAGAQQIPNAGFESWVAGNLFVAELPAGWTASGTFPTVVKSTDAHSGSYAMKLRVGNYFTGVGADRVSYAFGVPTSTTQPLYYTYWAKINLSGSDKFYSDADLTNQGSTLLITTIPYGLGQFTSADNTNIWKQRSFAMQGTGSMPYDSVTLAFYFPTANDTSSYVIIDDLAFSQNPAGIADISAESSIENVYPNPAQNMATVFYTINENAAVTLDVYDLLGTKISSEINANQSSGKYKAELNTSSLPAGIYMLRLTVNGQTHVQKLTVQH